MNAEPTNSHDDQGGVSPDVLALLDQHDAARPPAEDGDGGSPPPPAAAEQSEKPAAPAADTKAFEDRFAQLQEEKAKLAARTAQLDEREAAAPSLEAWKRDAISELRRMAASVVGDDEKKIASYLADEIYEPLMVELLALKDPDKLDPGIRNRAEIRRLNRSLETEKRAREDHQRSLERQQQEAAEQTKLQQVKGTLTRWIEGKGSDYPHLTQYSQSPADDVFEIMLQDESLSPERAAQLAEKHYATERKRYSDQVPGGRTPTAAGTPATKSGPPSATTRAASLTNSGATEATATSGDSPPDDPDASASYWADRLERDPESVKTLIKKRR